MANTITSIVLPSTRKDVGGYAAARDLNAGLLATRFGPRLAANEGGFPEMIPPFARLDVNNRIPCQSPAKGRLH